MSPADRKKLAKAARELAMECVAGTAPEFGTGQEFKDGKPWCAMGHVTAKARLPHRDAWATEVGNGSCALYWTLAAANDGYNGAARCDALVFPLLWAATELDGKIP